MFYTDDPVADYERYDQEQTKREAKRPHCEYCGRAIYESYYNINGEILCADCLDDNFKQYTED